MSCQITDKTNINCWYVSGVDITVDGYHGKGVKLNFVFNKHNVLLH